MKIAVVGVGRFGQNHVRTLSEMGLLSGVADLNAEAVAKAAETYGVPGFTDPQALIETRPDGIVIATPAHVHFPVAKQVLEAGIPCFVEKPLTLDVAEGEALVALANAKNVPLMVGHLLIYQPAIQFIKEKLEEGLIGKLVGLHQERLNLGKARDKENALWSLGVHDVAVAMYLIGSNPVSSQFFGQSVITPGVEDDTYLHLSFEGGVKATIHSSWLWPHLQRKMTLIGENGMIVFNESTKQVVHVKKRIDSALNNVDEGEEVIFEASGQPLTLELQHFCDSIANGTTPISDGQSGVEVIRVLAACGA